MLLQFTQYLAREISSAMTSDGSDDEDEDGGWLTQSDFNSNRPTLSAREASQSIHIDGRTLAANNFDVGIKIFLR